MKKNLIIFALTICLLTACAASDPHPETTVPATTVPVVLRDSFLFQKLLIRTYKSDDSSSEGVHRTLLHPYKYRLRGCCSVLQQSLFTAVQKRTCANQDNCESKKSTVIHSKL